MSWLSDLFGTNEEKANKQRIRLARDAQRYLDPADKYFRNTYETLQGYAAPMLNQMVASQGLAGQQAVYGIQGALGRAGLGNTGLGTALGAGARAGAAFQGNVLRAKILQDLLGQTADIQGNRASILAGVPIETQQMTGAQGVTQFGMNLAQSFAESKI